MTPYQFAVSNTRRYIRSEENQAAAKLGTSLTAFDAARTLAIAFVKLQADVLSDLLENDGDQDDGRS